MKTSWPLIFISYASLFVFGICDNIRGPLFSQILKDFHLLDSKGSLIFALSSFFGFISSYFARYLFTFFNKKIILQGASLLLTVTLWGFAFSKGFSFFLFFCAMFGFSAGALGILPNILVSRGSSSEKKQQLLSGLHAMYGIASLLAPLLVAGIHFFTNNWRITFLIVSFFPLMLFLYSLHKSHLPHHASPTKEKNPVRKKRNLFLKPQLFLAFMVSFTVAAEVMLSSRLALYMQRIWQFDLKSSSLYVTYFFTFLLIGRLLFSAIKFKRAPLFLLSSSIVVTIFFIIMGLFIHPFFLTISALGLAPFYPMAITFISSEFPESLDSALSYMMTTDSIMLVSMHLLTGRLTESFGIHRAIFSSILFLFISFLFINSYHLFFPVQSQIKS